jgi:RNA polymerase sigma-70 factor, ECF subfamily
MRCDAVEVSVETTRGWCELLYDKKAAALILYGRALGLSHGEAEDVVQEAFIALLRIERTPDCPEAYLYRTVRNRALNYKRGFWRRVTRELESSRWFERDPEETERERLAMKCLAQLPPEQREVIVLKIWSEQTFEEIGALLAISPNTAAGRYRYGMNKLRAELKGTKYEQLELQRGSTPDLETAPALA